MAEFIVEHKHCRAIRIVEGYDIYHALKINNLDAKIWVEKK